MAQSSDELLDRTPEPADRERRRHDGTPTTGTHAASRLAIVVDGLVERFRIPTERPPGLKERLYRFRRARYAEFEALSGVSLQVRHGESLGVIGHNGSGKSTLLKCLAGILPADEGTVEVNGRVATLLELGAGFHPDLTGRENVYQNGAMLGLRRREIDAAFESIAEFAGVRDFLDIPVRNYSSGMYVRLGFAIAVHVDPEILLVDEVLAVGDAEFQERSLARMRAFSRRGKTVVLVSHDLGSIAELCERTIVLDHGRLVFDGPTAAAVDFYDELVHGVRQAPPPEPVEEEPTTRTGDGQARVSDVRLLLGGEPIPQGPDAGPLPSGATLQLVVSLAAEESIREAGSLSVGIDVRRPDMQLYVYETRTGWRGTYLAPPKPGAVATLTFTLDLAVLAGEYLVDLLVANASTGVIHDRWLGACGFRVSSPEYEFGVARMDPRIGIWNPDGWWPPDIHAPPLERGGPREHPLREGTPSPGYEPGLLRLRPEDLPARSGSAAPTARVKVTACVVSWNTAGHLPGVLRSLADQGGVDLEIVVVDNASQDGSAEVARGFDGVRVVANAMNYGFAGAANQGVDVARENGSEAFLVCNPDVVLDPGYLERATRALGADGRRGAVQGKLWRFAQAGGPGEPTTRVIDTTGHLAFRTRLFRNRGEGQPDGGQFDHEGPVFGVSGALALYRIPALDDVACAGEVFDEDLFAFWEDVDLDWRMALRGWDVWYEPQATAWHERGGAGPRRSALVERLNFRNRFLVVLKNDAPAALAGALPGVALTSVLKTGELAVTVPSAFLRSVADRRLIAPTLVRRRMVQARATVDPAAVVHRWFAPFDYEAWVRTWWLRTRERPAAGPAVAARP